MATASQTITAPVRLTPFRTIYPEPQRWSTAEPWGQCIHTEDSVAVTASGAGNEKRIQLDMGLPQGFFYRLVQFWATLRVTETDWGLLGNAVLMLYLAADGSVPSGGSTQLELPCSRFSLKLDPLDTAGEVTTFTWGSSPFNAGASGNATIAFDRNPAPMMWGYWDQAAASGVRPSFFVGTDTQNTAAGNISYYAKWLAYGVEQAAHSALHWRVPTT